VNINLVDVCINLVEGRVNLVGVDINSGDMAVNEIGAAVNLDCVPVNLVEVPVNLVDAAVTFIYSRRGVRFAQAHDCRDGRVGLKIIALCKETAQPSAVRGFSHRGGVRGRHRASDFKNGAESTITPAHGQT
jgi:hypothetical protein